MRGLRAVPRSGFFPSPQPSPASGRGSGAASNARRQIGEAALPRRDRVELGKLRVPPMIAAIRDQLARSVEIFARQALLCSPRRDMPHSPRGHDAGGGRMADVKLFLSCVSDEFGAYRETPAPCADAAERRDQDPGGFQDRSAATRSPCSKTISSAATRRPFRRRDGGLGPGGDQRRRSSQAAARPRGAARGQGHGARGARRA